MNTGEVRPAGPPTSPRAARARRALGRRRWLRQCSRPWIAPGDARDCARSSARIGGVVAGSCHSACRQRRAYSVRNENDVLSIRALKLVLNGAQPLVILRVYRSSTWPPTAGEERKHPKVMIFEFISGAFLVCLWAGHRKCPHFAQSPHAFPLGKTATSPILSFIPPSVSGHAQGALTDFHRTKNSSEEPHARGGTCLVK